MHRRLLRALLVALAGVLIAAPPAPEGGLPRRPRPPPRAPRPAPLTPPPAAHAGLFFPESGGSPNADSIKTLYVLVFILALFIFVGVEGALLYSLFKYKAK